MGGDVLLDYQPHDASGAHADAYGGRRNLYRLSSNSLSQHANCTLSNRRFVLHPKPQSPIEYNRYRAVLSAEENLWIQPRNAKRRGELRGAPAIT